MSKEIMIMMKEILDKMEKDTKANRIMRDHIKMIEERLMNLTNRVEKENKINKKKSEEVMFRIDIDQKDLKNNPFEAILNSLNKKKDSTSENNNYESDDDNYNTDTKIYETEEREQDKNMTEISRKIESIQDIIELGNDYRELVGKNKDKIKKTEKYTEIEGKKYPIDLEKICNLTIPLKILNNMIGMKRVKEDMYEMIIYYLQGFERKNKNMLHTVIEGPAGVGKTKLGKIISKIYCALGIIPSNKFKYVKATDLIGEHVGATKRMTQNAIDEANGGVLFIDEAYALSSSDTKDPYGKECIDTINFNLSENKSKLIVIIAGYPDQLEKCFFSYNEGLQRRFPFRFRIDGYNAEELRDIFLDKLKRSQWKLSNELTMEKLTNFFKKNKDEFIYFGGDIENLFKSCQFTHSRRVIGKNVSIREKFTIEDIENGLTRFKKNRKEDDKKKYDHLYL